MKRLLRQYRGAVQRLLALRTERGPYRVLLRRWEGISDINLAIRVLGTDFFREELVPMPLPLKSISSILVIAPHQDDEAIGAGGTLLLASAAGVKLDVLYVTDGASRKPKYAATSSDSVRIRDEEAQEVCSRLGANIHRLGISNVIPRPTVRDVERLSEIIHDLKPEVVMAPWILDSPAKHRLVNHLLWLAHKRKGLPDFEVWGYQVHNTLFPNGYVDITSVAGEKRKLLECYRSQNENQKRYDHQAMGMAAWNGRFVKSTEPSYLEVFFTQPLHELLRLVETFYFSDLNATYRGYSNVISGISALHQAALKSNPKS